MLSLLAVACGFQTIVTTPRGVSFRSLAPRDLGGDVFPTAPAPVLDLPGDTLEELPEHRLIVLGTTALAGASAVAAASHLAPLEMVVLLACAFALADLMTGVFHWATDNYGSLETPLVGPACAAFQGHHRAPWTITYRSTCNNVFKIAKIVAPLIALVATVATPPVAFFLIVALYSQILSQEFHKYSHMKPRDQPPLIRVLQDNGLAISTKEHGRHHTDPFDGRYCIFNGMLNPLLDNTLFFRRLEALVYRISGVEANCWSEGDKGAGVKELALSL
ncbi:hypothetical protein CTAYLR_009062 [Chrysophaeum taylorii]|uniref:Lipid desaturase domain-containing protein n=1 Tax=Chrysophaeum taylorii TaxID=2483200 RepID=A0AAD7UL11_9STRA|nr:hypothetical protein CTAYLR_009062 [Chrysophaeum taylorii]